MVRPQLFILFMNEFYEMLNEYECKDIYIDESLPSLITNVRADDIVCFADFLPALQKQVENLNCLECFCMKCGMKVNMTKSKVMVSSRGGILGKSEKWYYRGVWGQLQILGHNFYKYLGTIFYSIFTLGKTQSSQA